MIVSEARAEYSRSRFGKIKSIYAVHFDQVSLNSSFDFIKVAEDGLSASVLTSFEKEFGFDKVEIASILNTSEPSLYRWIQKDQALEKNTAIRLLEITYLLLEGEEVFENKNNFKDWMGLPNLAYGGITPLQLIAYPEGISKVHNLLMRIEHSVFS